MSPSEYAVNVPAANSLRSLPSATRCHDLLRTMCANSCHRGYSLHPHSPVKVTWASTRHGAHVGMRETRHPRGNRETRHGAALQAPRANCGSLNDYHADSPSGRIRWFAPAKHAAKPIGSANEPRRRSQARSRTRRRSVRHDENDRRRSRSAPKKARTAFWSSQSAGL